MVFPFGLEWCREQTHKDCKGTESAEDKGGAESGFECFVFHHGVYCTGFDGNGKWYFNRAMPT
jgi:hypothetical protein